MLLEPAVYGLLGKIGSGKTYWIEHHLLKGQAMVFNMDRLMKPLFQQTLERPEFQEKSGICRDFMYQLAMQALEAKLPVIFDFGYWERRERDLLRACFQGQKVQFLYFPLDEEEQWRRVEHRHLKDPGCYPFSRELLHFLNGFFEAPMDDERDILEKQNFHF